MSDYAVVRPMTVADLPDYKTLRDEMLLLHPEAFTSDAASEQRKEPAEYLQRLGLDRRDGGHFLLGAHRHGRLLGAIGCERETRAKVRHIGHVVAMMVAPGGRRNGVGRALLDACISEGRRAGLELLTLSVTAGNTSAVDLYETSGFVPYGTLKRALKIEARYYDKMHMALVL